jgi:hypothetical protein
MTGYHVADFDPIALPLFKNIRTKPVSLLGQDSKIGALI